MRKTIYFLAIIATMCMAGCQSQNDKIQETCEKRLKQFLNDPNSLVVYSMEAKEVKEDDFEVKLDYGAKNGFGGMVRNTVFFSVSKFGSNSYVCMGAKETKDDIWCPVDSYFKYGQKKKKSN